MWQRIQTLYIGIATALTAAMFFCRMATIIGPEGNDIDIRYYEKLPYLMMLIMLLTAGVCAVFTYKSRLLRARVCILTALMLIGFQIWLGIDILINRNDMSFSLTAMFPLLAAFLDFAGAKKSMIDEMTVQAVKSARTVRKRRK